VALNVLIDWLQDNIDCGNMIIFDNDEDNTDSAVLLPWIERRVRTFAISVIFSFCNRPVQINHRTVLITHISASPHRLALCFIRKEIMSELTLTEPEVLTGHTDVICSTSIERIVTGRNAALAQIETLMQQLDDISTLTRSIGGKTALDWAMKQDFRCGCWLMEKPEAAMKAITRNLDRGIWRDLMKKSGMLSLMDAQAREQWYNSLEKDDIPAVSEANILSTFEQLHQNKGEVFERGAINVFKGLSWDFKSNSPCKFGKKIIVTGLVKCDRWGFGLNWGWQRDRLQTLNAC
jgi:hypothetical protein